MTLCGAARAETTISGYGEAFYAHNFTEGSSSLIGLRAFDNRADSFALQNAALTFDWKEGRAHGKAALQFGLLPGLFWASEPSSPGDATAAVPGLDAQALRYVQQGYVGYTFDVGAGLDVDAGVFLSPIGFEVVPSSKDNWTWSRSNLFFSFPYYHSGLRLTQNLEGGTQVVGAVWNGWNNALDNNGAKSVMVQWTRPTGDVTWSALYFGGAERAAGAPEGLPWRHHLDGWVGWNATPNWQFAAQVDAGAEFLPAGAARWTAAALYARHKISDVVYAAVRADALSEKLGVLAEGNAAASALALPSAADGSPTEWLAEATATLEYRPSSNASFRVEYRHDQTSSDVFPGATRRLRSQDTLTLSLSTWF